MINMCFGSDLERIREGIGSKFSMLTQYSSTFIFGIAVGFHANTKLTSAMIILAPLIIGISAVVAKVIYTIFNYRIKKSDKII